MEEKMDVKKQIREKLAKWFRRVIFLFGFFCKVASKRKKEKRIPDPTMKKLKSNLKIRKIL
jgi:hypothetical protein